VIRHVADERLSAFIGGDLPEREAAAVREHVDGCDTCAGVAAELAALARTARALDRPEPPPTLWPAIAGAIEDSATAEARQRRFWSWRASLVGALAGGVAVAVAIAAWSAGGLGRAGGGGKQAIVSPARAPTGEPRPAAARGGGLGADPLLLEAEAELERAAMAYEQAAARLRAIVMREQRRWDPQAQARMAELLARLDEAVAKERAALRRDPSDGAGAELLFAAYRRQIDFLAEVVHRGSPGESAWR
jgi:hypothetical protein